MDDSGRPKPKRRRRWFRFSLRTLLILTAVFAAWLGVWVDRARKQRRAVTMIEEAGGSVVYDYNYTPSRKPEGPAWLRESIGNEYFDDVLQVNLDFSRATDAALDYLSALPKMAGVGLRDARITDEGLKHLADCEQVRWLVLDRTQATDAGLVYLKQLPELQSLSLQHTRVTDAGLEHLKSIPSLTSLFLASTKVTDTGLVQLEGLTNLQTL